MTEPDNSSILVAIAEVRGELAAFREGVGGEVAGVRQRIDAIEVARSVARHEQDEWRDEVRNQLREIREQTTLTNGKVQKHALLFAEMKGAANMLRWWPGAVAGAIVALVVYLLSHS